MAETAWPRPSGVRARRPERLAAAECAGLLRDGGEGHVSLDRPAEHAGTGARWPVRYRVRGDTILFRLPGGAYDGTPLGVLALHAYGIEGAEPWSVVATGDARDVTDPLELVARHIDRVHRGQDDDDRGVLVELRPRHWRGRRFPAGPGTGS